MRRLHIDNRAIGDGEAPLVIAEIGVNHDGSLARAAQLVELAAEVGADAVKFQIFRADRLLHASASFARYQKDRSDDADDDPAQMLRRYELPPLDVARLVTMARYGLGVLHEPVPAVTAAVLQIIGWMCQLFAVWAAMRAFDIHEPLPAAGLVLVLMNVAMLYPLWPGNVGLVQAAVALPLVSYGVPYAKGFAFGIGLQAIEMSVGVGVGLVFLAREGITFAALRRIPEAEEAEDDQPPARMEAAARAERARVPG